MRQKFILLTVFVLLTGLVRAQETGIKPSVLIGEVASIAADKIVLQTKDGAVDVMLTGTTEFKRVLPENPSLKSAVASALTDIGAGDKIVVSGVLAADKKSIPARTVFLMTKSDIAQRQSKELEQWRTRGIVGRVAAINPQTKEITVSVRGLMGETKTVVKPNDNAAILRYAPDSVDYNAAQKSNLGEIKVGDSIRALGDKSADNATMQAERIITGSFQTVGGTITAIDAEKNEITITNIQTKKPVTVVVGKNTLLKKFPEQLAQRMMLMQSGGGAGMMRPPNGAPQPPQPPNGQTPQPPNGGGQQRGAGGFDEMLDGFPAISLADLKVGDMIAFSSTKTQNEDRLTAIKLLSGVEPFLKMAQMNGGRGNGGNRGGQDSGFSIPGLEGGNF